MLKKNILMLNLFTKYLWLSSYFDNNFLSLLKNNFSEKTKKNILKFSSQKQLHESRKENS